MSIGIDMEEVDRFKNKSQKFLDRVYTQLEQEYCLKKAMPEKHLAVRFCAKEAAIKALNALNIKYPELNKIEIYHSENKCPQIRLLNKIDKDLTFELSLSHDRTKAIAVVMVNKK